MSDKDPKRLIPRKVLVSGAFKSWGGDKEKGTSEGSEISVEFEIPDGLEGLDLRKLIMEEKERLDVLCLTAEKFKGAVSDSLYKLRRELMKRNYDKLLGRENGNTSNPES